MFGKHKNECYNLSFMDQQEIQSLGKNGGINKWFGREMKRVEKMDVWIHPQGIENKLEEEFTHGSRKLISQGEYDKIIYL